MPITETDEVSLPWQRWAALSLLEGQPLSVVISEMSADGVPETAAAAVCAEIMLGGAAYEAAKVTLAQLHKLESFLDVRRQMLELSPRGAAVERRSSCGGEEFLEEYYAANRPVVLQDVCDIWPARGLWTPEYLVETIGAAEIEVMTGREEDALYERNADDHRQLMPFDEYVAKAMDPDVGNDVYLVANNQFLASAEATPLWDDFAIDQRYLRQDNDHSEAFLWLGPVGTVTPLHHDAMNILFNQVVGRKRFRLFSPLESPYLYNSESVYSEIDPRAPDIERFPLYTHAHPIEFVLEPGETLFLPVGWWHHVESLDICASVSFTSFVWDNGPEWFELESPD